MTTPTALDTALPAVRTDPVALTLPDELDWDTWASIGRQILAASAGSMWWLGDWILYAERRWATDPDTGDELPVARARIRQILGEAVNVELQTIKNARAVAKRFPPSRRRDTLPWSHHETVAACDDAVADELLDQAETEGWSRDQLRQAKRQRETLEAAETEPAAEPPVKPVRVALRVTVAPEAEGAVREVLEQIAEALPAQLRVRCSIDDAAVEVA